MQVLVGLLKVEFGDSDDIFVVWRVLQMRVVRVSQHQGFTLELDVYEVQTVDVLDDSLFTALRCKSCDCGEWKTR